MGPLKIICFLFDPNIGGPTIRARAVYSRMISNGYDVRVAFPKGEGSAASYMFEAGIPVDKLPIEKPVLPRKLVPFLRFLLTAPISVMRVRRFLRREQPDVIHVNGAFDLIPALAGWLARVPVVWHLNDTVFSSGLSQRLGSIVRRIASVVVIAATRVGQHYNVMAANPHVIFAPVDVERFTARSPENYPRDEPMLSLIGNWNWIKGHDRFVDVIAGLSDQGLKVRGMAVGRFLEGQKAYWQPIVDRMQRDGLNQLIDCPGFSDDMVGVLRDTDILLLTSHSEASPMSLLEAMSVGVPVVTFDVGGVREMLGEGIEAAGFVVPEGDVDAMIAAATQILTDPSLYQRLARSGQSRARAHFSLETCVQRHETAYAEAVGCLKRRV